MNPVLRGARDFLVSLKLTVALLGLGILLVFAATLAQVDFGIWKVQQEFFHSFVAIWKIGPVYVPLPGGYLVGGLLLINLISAHVYRFKFSWRKLGIWLAHVGLILLLFGELLSGLWQEDFNMRLTEGETRNYAESYRDNELAFVDITDPQADEHVVIPESFLKPGATLQHPKLPFRVVVKDYFANSQLRQRGPVVDAGKENKATTGAGLQFLAESAPLTYKQDERNYPAAFIEISGPGTTLGTWLVSQAPYLAGRDDRGRPQIAQLNPQRFEHAGRTWTVALRPRRAYKPFSLTLLDFTHDRYVGTDIPKNFSSKLHLQTPDGRDDRDVLIYMNSPLRYAGLTFYQSGYDGEKTTVLQVVQNPSWLIPYIACVLITFGLVIQFMIHLVGFIVKRRAAA